MTETDKGRPGRIDVVGAGLGVMAVAGLAGTGARTEAGAAVAVAAAAVVTAATWRWWAARWRVALACGVWLALQLAAVGVAQDRTQSAAALGVSVVAVAAVGAGAVSAASRRGRIWLGIDAAAMGALGTIAALRRWTTSGLDGEGNLWRMVDWHNQSAALGAVLLCAAVAAAVGAQGRARVAATVAAGLAAAGWWTAGSRGGLAAGLVGLAVVVFGCRRWGRRLAATAVAVAVVGAVGVGVLAGLAGDRPSAADLARREDAGGETRAGLGPAGRAVSAGDNFAARLEYWRLAVRLVAEHPGLGTGPGSYARQAWRYRAGDDDIPSSAHNGYLEAFAETGVAGGAVFAGLTAGAIGALVRGGRRRDDLLAIGAAGAGWVFVVHTAVDFDWHYPTLVVAGTAAIGVAWARGDGPRAPGRWGRPVAAGLAGLCAVVAAGSVAGYGASAWAARQGTVAAFDADGTYRRIERLVLTQHRADPESVRAARAREILALVERTRPWNPGDPRLDAFAALARFELGALDAAAFPAAFERPGEAPWPYLYPLAAHVAWANDDLATARRLVDAGSAVLAANPGISDPSLVALLWYERALVVAATQGCDAAAQVRRDAVAALTGRVSPYGPELAAIAHATLTCDQG